MKTELEYGLIEMTEADREVLDKLRKRKESIEITKWIAYVAIVLLIIYLIYKDVVYMAFSFVPLLFLVHILTNKKLANGNFKRINEDLLSNKKRIKRGIVRKVYVALQNPPSSKIGKMYELYKLNMKSDIELLRNDPAFINKTDFNNPLLFSYDNQYCCKVCIEAEDGLIYECLSHCNTIKYLTINDRCWIEVAAKSDIPVNITK